MKRILKDPELLETEAYNLFYEIDKEEKYTINFHQFKEFLQKFTKKQRLKIPTAQEISIIFKDLDCNEDDDL